MIICSFSECPLSQPGAGPQQTTKSSVCIKLPGQALGHMISPQMSYDLAGQKRQM
jgi:hypothetical protein